MSVEQVSVKSHYRTMHNGKVVFVHDYHAGHEVNRTSRAAHFHERTVIGKHTSGATYLRATDDADADHIRRAATAMGIASSEETREANHHGNTARFTHFDFGSIEAAKSVMQMAASSAYADEEQIHEELGGADDDYAAIFGDLQLGEIGEDEANAEFAAIFGDLDLPRTGPYTLTMADLATLQADLGVDRLVIGDKPGFIAFWNEKIKVDPREYLGPIVKELNTAHTASEELFALWCAKHPDATQAQKDARKPARVLSICGSGLFMSFRYTNFGMTCGRSYSFRSAPSVSHDIWQIPANIRGDGMGKKAFAASVEFYKAIGIKKIQVHANIDVGGYCWSRYRFLPDSDENLRTIKNKFTSNSARMPPALTSDSAIRRCLASNDLRSGWALADTVSHFVKIGEADVAAQIAALPKSQQAAAKKAWDMVPFDWETVEDQLRALPAAEQEYARKIRALRPRQAARNQGGIIREENPLLWANWYGHIDLTNDDHVGHLMDYLTNKPTRVVTREGNRR